MLKTTNPYVNIHIPPFADFNKPLHTKTNSKNTPKHTKPNKNTQINYLNVLNV